jgi:hypothetical protein
VKFRFSGENIDPITIGTPWSIIRNQPGFDFKEVDIAIHEILNNKALGNGVTIAVNLVENI